MKTSAQLKAEKQSLLDQQQAMIDAGLTDETRPQYDALTEQVAALDGDIGRAEALETQVADAAAEPASPDAVGPALQAIMAGTTTSLSETVIKEIDKQIIILLQKSNPMRALARSVTTSSGIFEQLVSTSAVDASWVGETDARTSGKSTNFETVTITAGELFGSVPYTQRVLDMSSFDLVAWAQQEMAKAFSAKERQAMFIDGDGTDHKPVGLLTHVDTGTGVQKIDSMESGTSTDFDGDDLIDMTYELETEYLDGSVWVMNRQTARKIRKFKDNEDRYIWTDGFGSAPTTLLGYPVQIVDEMPAAGAAGNFPIIFGNLNQAYCIVNHTTGTRLVRDALTAKPNVLLDTTRYCGGDVIDGQAVKVLKIKA